MMDFKDIDVEVVGNVVLTIAILAIFVERALSVLFESRWFIDKTDEQKTIEVTEADGIHLETQKIIRQKKKGMKEIIALIVSIAVAATCKIDAIGAIIDSQCLGWIGYALTGGIIAGGTKGSIKLFRDVFNIMSTAQRDKMKLKEQMEYN